MVRIRRISLALMAALAAQLLAPGVALACPAAASICTDDSRREPSGCDGAGKSACIMTCGIACPTLIPESAGAVTPDSAGSTPFWLAVRPSRPHDSGPEPPPPRMG